MPLISRPTCTAYACRHQPWWRSRLSRPPLVINPLLPNVSMTSVVRFEMATNNVNQFTIISYNMHGLSQGAPLLNELLNNNDDNIDACFLQEHWLTPVNLNKLRNFSAKFTYFGKSAMEHTISNSVLRGRPFGGVGIFLNNNLRSKVLYHTESDRFAIVVLANVILLSIYLPTIKCSNDSSLILVMLSEIESYVSDYSNLPIVCGGDCNSDLRNNTLLPESVRDFISNLNLVVCDHFSATKNSLSYTYHHESLGHKSCIDYFLSSHDVINRISECVIFDHALNLSDHLPIK